jgi:hypothetical protein
MPLFDDDFYKTVPAGIIVAAALYFSCSRQIRNTWRCRMVISMVIATGTTPHFFWFSGAGIAGKHLLLFPGIESLPLVFFKGIPQALFKYKENPFTVIESFFWDYILPFILTASIIYFLLLVVGLFKSRHEKPSA